MFLSALRLRTPCSLHVPQTEKSMNLTTKMSSSEDPDMAALTQDNVPLSEMDKAAVLTMIREEVHHCHTLNGTMLLFDVLRTL